MKKNVISFVLALMLSCSFAFAGCGGTNNDGGSGSQSSQTAQAPKSDEEQIQATLDKFVEEYNAGDFEGVLSCMEPVYANVLSVLFEMLGGYAGGKLGVDINMSDLFGLGVAMQGGDFIALTTQEIAISGYHASVTTKMKLAPAVEETMYFLFIKEGQDWLIQGITDEKSGIGSGEDIVVNSLWEEGFVDGLMKISYKQEDTTYWGVVNTNGEVIYSQEGALNGWNHMGNGTGWVSIYNAETKKRDYFIINNQGEKVVSNVELGFDKIIGAGNGLAWVYKYQTGINGAKHLYGVINSKGEWVSPMREVDFKYSDDYLSSYSKLMGDNFFVYYYYTANSGNYFVYNINTGVGFQVGSVRGEINGDLYCHGYLMTDENNEPYWIEECRIQPDGTVSEMDKYDKFSDGKLITYHTGYNEETDKEEDFIEIYNVVTGKSVIYDDYSAERVESIQFEGAYGLVIIQGLDYNYYFTLIDENGNQQFEPISFSLYYGDLTYSDGVIVYNTLLKNKDTYVVMDTQGNVLVPESAGYCWIGTFNNGLAAARIAETQDWVVIDTQGNVVIEEFQLK